MSGAFVPFLYELRARKVKVGAQEALALARALDMGLHDSSLDGFYHLARAICVHRESDLDKFDEAFLAHFKGITIESMELASELEEWLKDPANRKELSADELAALESIDMESLKKLFEQRMKEQKERHQGGNRWIGSGGTSPFGQQGENPSGLRVGEMAGGRSAMGIADARKYRPYRSDIVLDIRQIEVALRKLRAFQREGLEDELDIDGTIDATAKNAGELEIVLRPPRKSNVRVLLLMDARADRLAPLLGREARIEHSPAQDVLLPQLRLRPRVRDGALQRAAVPRRSPPRARSRVEARHGR
jgi:uncharacterized protein with von Willebrand factor type A (vWA) domain